MAKPLRICSNGSLRASALRACKSFGYLHPVAHTLCRSIEKLRHGRRCKTLLTFDLFTEAVLDLRLTSGASMKTEFSKARTTFDSAIKDAEELLAHCNSLGHPLPQRAEVFKRAGLVMALTAWETYVEDRVVEGVRQRVPEEPSHAEKFMLLKLDEELKKFNTPAADKTRRLFIDYLAVDVTAGWHWNGVDTAKAREKLDGLVKKRGDAVHRSKVSSVGVSAPHLVSKDDLEKAIRFLKELVAATERALSL